MAKPRVFISSTFYDLRHIRASLENFVTQMGYEAILSEKGRIAYDPDIPLDESCYREAFNSDILVLIIGGRYGSAASQEQLVTGPDFYERYESITKKEYEAASNRDIPTYILVDNSVYSEYQTYLRNKDSEEVKYAHVDSANVFRLLEQILSKRRNNPVYQFERNTDIEDWLREQWAELFRELINRRSQERQLSSLTAQIKVLSSVSSSLQRYMEEIVRRVSSSEEAEEIIESEGQKLELARKLKVLEEYSYTAYLMDMYNFPPEEILRIYSQSSDVSEIYSEFRKLYETNKDKFRDPDAILPRLIKDKSFLTEVNGVRQRNGISSSLEVAV